MKSAFIIFAAILLTVSTAVSAQLPDPSELRATINLVITGAEVRDGKITFGPICEAAGLSIYFGAAAFNAGAHEACYRFYRKTAADVLEAFPASGATPLANDGLRLLRAAVAEAELHDNDPPYRHC